MVTYGWNRQFLHSVFDEEFYPPDKHVARNIWAMGVEVAGSSPGYKGARRRQIRINRENKHAQSKGRHGQMGKGIEGHSPVGKVFPPVGATGAPCRTNPDAIPAKRELGFPRLLPW